MRGLFEHLVQRTAYRESDKARGEDNKLRMGEEHSLVNEARKGEGVEKTHDSPSTSSDLDFLGKGRKVIKMQSFERRLVAMMLSLEKSAVKFVNDLRLMHFSILMRRQFRDGTNSTTSSSRVRNWNS